jgi:hypothetical protein
MANAVGVRRLGYAVRKTSDNVVPVCATTSWPCIEEMSRVIVEGQMGLRHAPVVRSLEGCACLGI